MQHRIHKADERGEATTGWLNARHSFSFAHWYDPERMGFGALRVLNDDTIAPHAGFPQHSHANMEIITIVTDGVLTHEDSMGNTGTVQAGEVQIMSAGNGVMHAEYNHAPKPLTLFQIWIEPNVFNTAPRYAQAAIPWQNTTGITRIVGPVQSEFPLTIQQDAYIHAVTLASDKKETYTLTNPENGVYVFVVEGTITIGETILTARDAVEITGAKEIPIAGTTQSTVLVFEIPL